MYMYMYTYMYMHMHMYMYMYMYQPNGLYQVIKKTVWGLTLGSCIYVISVHQALQFSMQQVSSPCKLACNKGRAFLLWSNVRFFAHGTTREATCELNHQHSNVPQSRNYAAAAPSTQAPGP